MIDILIEHPDIEIHGYTADDHLTIEVMNRLKCGTGLQRKVTITVIETSEAEIRKSIGEAILSIKK